MKKLIAVIAAVAVFALVAAGADTPKAEGFLGYNFVRFNPNSGYIPSFNANGGGGQFVYNLNKWIGGVFDAGAVNKGTLGGFDVESTVINFVAGPRVTIRNRSRFTPFVQALFGGAYSTASARADLLPIEGIILPSGIVLPPEVPISTRFNVSHTGFAMFAGGGLDIRLNDHIAFRPIGADYYLTRLPSLLTGGTSNRNNFRYSAGVNFLFGGEKPMPMAQPAPVATKTCPNGSVVPVTATCPKTDLAFTLSASRTDVCEGETVDITPAFGGANTNGMSLTWMVDGKPVSQAGQFQLNTAGMSPGMHRVGLTAGGGVYNNATREVTINVMDYRPPTGTVTANPTEIYVGDKSTVAASFTGQCGGTIGEPSFSASDGTIGGNEYDSSGVTFAANEQRKTVTITATAKDDRQSGTADTTITVMQKAAAIRLPDILFLANSDRVNNCGKRILLEQLKSYTERDPNGQVVVVGTQADNEKAPSLADSRAHNAAAIVTAGSGVCLSLPKDHVLVNATGTSQNGVEFQPDFCGASVVERRGQAVSANDATAQYRRVIVWFVPAGAQAPAAAGTTQSVEALSLGGLGCPK